MTTFVRLLILFLLLPSCVRLVEPPRFEAGESDSPHDAWARVLATVVDEAGRVDFARVARKPHDLYLYLDYVAAFSPTSHPEAFPTKADKLAYYINSYNALAMYGVIAYGAPDDFSRFLERARFFKFTEYRVGGRWISLYDFENAVIRPLDEPRVHFALNCMSVGCPRLPQTPFRAAHLDEQLDAAAREFFNSPKYVEIDASRGIVRLSEILDFYPEDFVNARHAPSLVAYANRYRDEAIPEGLEVEFIPYDWTVVKQASGPPRELQQPSSVMLPERNRDQWPVPRVRMRFS